MLRIVDANQYVRRSVERDLSGLTFRTLYNEIQASPDTYIYVWDGPGSLERRRAIFPGYKVKKPNEQPGEDVFKAFEFLQMVLDESRAIQVSVPTYEADDVIATLVGRFRDENDLHIHSTDQDFLQLGVPTDRESLKVEPEWVRVYKALVGDPSDKIPGVKGFGQKAWEGLSNTDLMRIEGWLLGNLLDITSTTPWPKASWNWLQDEANQELIRGFYSIVGFFDVPDGLIDRHTKIGRNNKIEAERLLNLFMG